MEKTAKILNFFCEKADWINVNTGNEKRIVLDVHGVTGSSPVLSAIKLYQKDAAAKNPEVSNHTCFLLKYDRLELLAAQGAIDGFMQSGKVRDH